MSKIMTHTPALMGTVAAGSGAGDPSALFPPLAAYLSARRGEAGAIPGERKAALDKLSTWATIEKNASRPIRLTFICTHNSRRSQMAQVWASAIGASLGLDVRACSGGTEVSAFNPRAVAALQRAGFQIETTTDDPNPVYHVRAGASRLPATCFSKRFDHPSNPAQDFAAVMVCSDADHACPQVSGAAARFAIEYQDPKAADGKSDEAAVYDERCAQIARELAYVFDHVARPAKP